MLDDRPVIVTGSRRLTFHERVWYVLDYYQPRIVVEGNATGADHAARMWLWNRGRPTRSYTADWDRYGKGAGDRRNGIMLRDWPTALVLAFPLPGCVGTKNCVDQAYGLGMEVEIYGWFY